MPRDNYGAAAQNFICHFREYLKHQCALVYREQATMEEG
jgi:hypothetical protein